jgi:hypothetical protein
LPTPPPTAAPASVTSYTTRAGGRSGV